MKKGIYLNLQKEAIACVQKEMTAMRRLSEYLADRQKGVQSCRDISREILEEYLTYLKTEDIETKSFHADLNRLRAILESIGKMCGYDNLELLFLNRDIPPARQPEFKVYSDSELQRLNAGIVKLDEQIARAMVIHQMLGTRISDTLTLQTDCLYESGGETIIRIRQMKTKTFEKPVSRELAELIRRAIAYTEERHGPTNFIFVDDKNPENPLPYNRLQNKVVEMIHKENLRDDNGRLFSYSETEARAASCTEAGIKVYSCSCGDSYTEGSPALGHSYHSLMTKVPTVSEEGVMTYTCTRCGHSYTAAISRLEAPAPAPGQAPGTGTGSTEKPGTGTGTAQESRPEPGLPFIKGEDGKTGWEVIRAEEEQAEEGSTINVDMNGTTIVPGDIFDRLRGRDITITFDMGGGIIWSVDGKSVTADKAGDIDLSVKTGVSTVPVDIVNNITGESYSIQISLPYEREFGFTAVLSINLGRENAGNTASLYYYNESIGELEFICADEVAEDGTVSLAFTHASDYVIAINGDEEEESGGVTEDAQPEETDGNGTVVLESPKTMQEKKNVLWPIAAGIIALAGIAFAAVFAWKKKKENESVKEEK